MNDHTYDLFVIGGGPGGYSAAIMAAKKGLKVGIAEGDRLGGTCTNTGCIPTKTYIESVNLYKEFSRSQKFGIEIQQKPFLDLQALHKRKDRIVSRLVKGIEFLLKENRVAVYPVLAEIIDPQTVKAGEQLIKTQSMIIATGSKPKKPPVFNLEGIWTSDDIFNITERPDSLIIIGGGVIGMEMGHIFDGLGTEVTIIEAMDRILPFEDAAISKELQKIYRKITIISNTYIKGISQNGSFNITADTKDKTLSLESHKVLLCIGREPTIPAGIHEVGISLNPSGGILVDSSMRTTIPHIYAIGDVTGEHMYAYVATKEACIAVENITGGHKKMNYESIPSIIFTHPEIASVGKKKQDLDLSDIMEGTFPISALGRARTMEAQDGYAHIYCTKKGSIERITIMAPHATELISWATLAIEKGLTIDEFLSPAYPHPTLSELLKEASEDALGICVHKS